MCFDIMDEYYKKCIYKADNDLKVAYNELNINNSDKITDAICFHCQQAIEKYLKAFLILNKIEFKKTHNLDFLLSMCINIDKDFSILNIDDLSSYAVEIRYPDDFYIPSVKEAENAYKIAINVKMFILNKLN